MKECVDEDTINVFAHNVNPVYVNQTDPEKVAAIRSIFDQDSIIELADFFQFGFIHHVTSNADKFR